MGIFCDRFKFGSTAALPHWPKQKQVSQKRAFIATRHVGINQLGFGL
jgi:hypothetical protein